MRIRFRASGFRLRAPAFERCAVLFWRSRFISRVGRLFIQAGHKSGATSRSPKPEAGLRVAIPLHRLPQALFELYFGFVAEKLFGLRNIGQGVFDITAALRPVGRSAGI